LVGSTALGAYRAGRSDVDFVAVVDRRLSTDEIQRIRVAQLVSGVRTATRAVASGHVALPGTVNGAYVAADDLSTPVTAIRPVASHVAGRLHAGVAFDVNPVVWKEFAEAGVVLRGPSPDTLQLDPEPDRLRQWNLDNLNRYWNAWGEAAASGRRANSRFSSTSWVVAWGALGAPRLHHTIATGEVISKEAAGDYALTCFDSKWHPTIIDALAFQRLEPASSKASRTKRIARAGEFVLEVVRLANGLD